jgi:hypothetical protein
MTTQESGNVERPLNLRYWGDYIRSPALMVASRPLLKPGSRVFTMGSCFAGELRHALKRAGFSVYPDYLSVKFDPATSVFNHVPKRDWIEHYDTFVIRQEFEAAFGVWTDRADGIWELSNMPANKFFKADIVYQEPCRKIIYSKTFEGAARLSANIDIAIRQGLEQSDIIVLTLGLIEVWQHNLTGRFLCRPPHTGYGGRMDLATFRQSTFLENYANVKGTLDLLFANFPQKQVILSVSPVPLGATFTAMDVATANTESKAVLRAVAGQICREYADRVSYFPAYEMATVLPGPVFMEDKRHVLPGFADNVVASFMNAFGKSV